MPQSSLAAPLGTKAKADKEGPLSTTKECVNVGISWHKWTLFYSLFLYREKTLPIRCFGCGGTWMNSSPFFASWDDLEVSQGEERQKRCRAVWFLSEAMNYS